MVSDAESEYEAAQQEPVGLFRVANPAVKKGKNKRLKEYIECVYLGDNSLGPHALTECKEQSASDASGGAKERLGVGIEGGGFFF